MIANTSLYSIGHGHKTQEEFLAELKSFDIEFVVDVRSSPYSKWAPQFNQEEIEHCLRQAGFRYVYMGDSIGGRPQSEDCYDEEGRYDYRKMAMQPSFEEGLERLVVANAKDCRTAIMCSETDPSECHRSKLIGRELYFGHHILVNHIVGENKVIGQEEIMEALTKGRWDRNGTLFGPCDPPYFSSCKSYRDAVETLQEILYD